MSRPATFSFSIASSNFEIGRELVARHRSGNVYAQHAPETISLPVASNTRCFSAITCTDDNLPFGKATQINAAGCGRKRLMNKPFHNFVH